MEANRALQFGPPQGISKRFRRADESDNLKAVTRIFGAPFALCYERNDGVSHVYLCAIESDCFVYLYLPHAIKLCDYGSDREPSFLLHDNILLPLYNHPRNNGML